MMQSITRRSALYHHPIVGSVEQRHMASELRRLLLGIVPSDKQSRQLHKDLQQQKNRAPDTIATIVVAGLKNDQESKVRAIAHAISGFCSAGKAKLQRRFPQLYPIETRE